MPWNWHNQDVRNHIGMKSVINNPSSSGNFNIRATFQWGCSLTWKNNAFATHRLGVQIPPSPPFSKEDTQERRLPLFWIPTPATGYPQKAIRYPHRRLHFKMDTQERRFQFQFNGYPHRRFLLYPYLMLCRIGYPIAAIGYP